MFYTYVHINREYATDDKYWIAQMFTYTTASWIFLILKSTYDETFASRRVKHTIGTTTVE